MGCCAASKAAEPELRVSGRDLRWDTLGFEEMTAELVGELHVFVWVRVGFLRSLAQRGEVIPHRQEMPAEGLHLGTPPATAQLFNVSWTWQTDEHPDPRSTQLREMVAMLDRDDVRARDDDLVWNDWACLHKLRAEEQQHECFKLGLRNRTRRLCLARIRTIVLPRVSADASPFLEMGWPMFELFLAAYSQRLLYAKGPGNEEVEQIIQAGLDPGRLADPRKLFLQDTKFTYEADREPVLKLLQKQFENMMPVPYDSLGFLVFCETAQIAWLRVGLVHDWAARGAFPFPRQQELPAGRFLLGAPPAGLRKFVVSHGWESEMHPSPSGCKMRQLAAALLKLEARDEDVVFFDFCSNSQAHKMGTALLPTDKPTVQGDGNPPPRPERDGSSGPYFAANGPFEKTHDEATGWNTTDRTSSQRIAFDYAMWEMGRLYSFHECEVIVLPTLADELEPTKDHVLASFPGGDVWGDINNRPYHNRGWCCAEFAVARYSNRIANLHDPSVQAVLQSRQWPSGGTAESCAMYADMMTRTTVEEMSKSLANHSELTYDPHFGVDFTSNGDRDAVKYNFFKMTMSKDSIGL